ncbi:hypothetical protein AB4084_01605, partial [Lysobacter sp. 2RAB21]
MRSDSHSAPAISRLFRCLLPCLALAAMPAMNAMAATPSAASATPQSSAHKPGKTVLGRYDSREFIEV